MSFPDLRRELPTDGVVFDVVVVGGGITGVHVSRELAARGLRTLLVEKDDFGSGTSSATTKYIHGGLRYLEQRQFGVVRESLRERRVLALAAPHLVLPRRFVLPAWRWSRPPAAVLGLGVGVYEALAFDRNRGVPKPLRVPTARWVRSGEVLRRAPWLEPDGLQGGFVYTDFLNIHPERLLLSFVKGAVAAGAQVLNHATVTGFLRSPGRVEGVVVQDGLGGGQRTVRARVVVNAAGPWAGELLGLPGGLDGTRVRTSKGVHLLLRALPGADPVLARTRDGRHVVVSPWQGLSLVGPTDEEVDGPVDSIDATGADVDTLLATLNSASSEPRTASDVEGVTVGVRPLVDAGDASSYTISRRADWIEHAATGVAGLWTLTGGKWTTARATAEAFARTLTEGPAAPLAATRRPAAALEPYGPALTSSDAAGLPAGSSAHLRRLYGAEAARLLERIADQPSLARRVSSRAYREDLEVQVVHGIEAESARTLDDLVDRRLVLGTVGPPTLDELTVVALVAAPLLGWDEAAAAEAVRVRRARDADILARWQ